MLSTYKNKDLFIIINAYDDILKPSKEIYTTTRAKVCKNIYLLFFENGEGNHDLVSIT